MRSNRLRGIRSFGAAGSIRALIIAGGALLAFTMPAGAQTRLSPQLDAQQMAAVSALSNVKSVEADAKGTPTFIEASLGTFRSQQVTRDADSAALMRKLRPLLRGDGTEVLRVRKSNLDGARGIRHHRMSQTIDGREVIGGEAILHVQESTSQVVSMDMQFLSGAGLPRSPSFSAADAMRNAMTDAQISNPTYRAQPRLAYRRMPDGTGHLVWVARIEHTDAQGVHRVEDILASATSGRLVERMPLMHEALNRQIRHFSTGVLLLSEGGTSADASANNLYPRAGNTYNYFSSTFGRDSWNGAGAVMHARVHGSTSGQNNATFDCGAGIAYFGDGDGFNFGDFTTALDIVAHEWTHGVTCSEANLTYSGQSGALNEAMSDIFGAAVEASITGVTANTWRVGEDNFTPGVPNDALRYMNNPTQDGFSRDYYPHLQPTDDVHYGSGIGNLAFHLLAAGGTHPRGLTSTTVTSIGIAAASRIFYLALRDYLGSSSDYSQARTQTSRVAREQYGAGSTQLLNTCAAWDAVAVPQAGAWCPDRPTLTQGSRSQTVFGITTIERGFASGMGSMSPTSTNGGAPYIALEDKSFAGGPFQGILSLSTYDPGSTYVVSVTANGVTKTGASATYSYTPGPFGIPGTATWTWSTPFGFTGSGTTAVTIIH